VNNMALRSRYRESARNIPTAEPANIPETPPQPSETTHIEFTDKAEPAIGIVSADEIPSPDEATIALKKQLADLRESERLQREFATQVAAQRAAQMTAPSREQKLAMWRQQGADEGDLEFLEQNPAMVDMHDLTRAASGEAEQQGHARGTEAHRWATKENFDRHLARLQAQPAASAEPAPALFAPRPSPSQESVHDQRAAIVSAPVSRREAGGYREPSPRSVKLSPIEQEIARNLGLTDTAYAEGKLKMLRAKAAGEMQ
jgi:hypothetical protein